MLVETLDGIIYFGDRNSDGTGSVNIKVMLFEVSNESFLRVLKGIAGLNDKNLECCFRNTNGNNIEMFFKNRNECPLSEYQINLIKEIKDRIGPIPRLIPD